MKKGLSKKSRQATVPGVVAVAASIPSDREFLEASNTAPTADASSSTPGADLVPSSAPPGRGLANNSPPEKKNDTGAVTQAPGAVQERTSAHRGSTKLAKLSTITGRRSVAQHCNQATAGASDLVHGTIPNHRGSTKLAKLSTITGRRSGRSSSTPDIISSTSADPPGLRLDAASIIMTSGEMSMQVSNAPNNSISTLHEPALPTGDMHPRVDSVVVDSATSNYVGGAMEENLIEFQHPTTEEVPADIESPLGYADEVPQQHSGLSDDAADTAATRDENEGLVVANPVSDDNQVVDRIDAKEINLAEQDQRRIKRRTKTYCIVGLGMLVIAGIILVIFFTLLFDPAAEDPSLVYSSSAPTTHSPTGSPSMAPSLSMGEYFKTLLPTFTVYAIENDPASAQSLAFEWIKDDMSIGNFSYDRLVQRFALMTFYYATTGDEWQENENWSSHNTSECQWSAKFDFEPDPVSQQQLAESGLDNRTSGPLPCSNDQVTAVYLNSNSLSGAIPPEIGLLTSLIALRLGNNKLQYTIPTELGLLTHLVDVNLPGNQLAGPIPTQIGLVTNVLSVELQVNHLTGPLPSELGQLSRLVQFNVDDYQVQDVGNSLNGTIPSELGGLRSIQSFVADYNNLEGPIPSQIGLIGQNSSQVILSLRNNQLTGTIPSEVGNVGALYLLILHWNNLSGEIPTELGQATNLFTFAAAKNALRGKLPSQMGQMEALGNLFVTGNLLTGALPSELGICPNLRSLWFPENPYISGTVPTEIASLATSGALVEFGALGTNLSGTIPDAFCSFEEESLSFDCSDVLCGCDCECPLSIPTGGQSVVIYDEAEAIDVAAERLSEILEGMDNGNAR